MACAKCRTAWIGHHQLHLFVGAQQQRQIQRVQPRRFQDHSHPLPPAGESAQQPAMPGGSVGKPLQLYSLFPFSRHHQLSCTYFHSTGFDIVHGRSLE
jgi:hypothetical protein